MARTDLVVSSFSAPPGSPRSGVWLRVGGVDFQVAHYVGTHAVNEIPTAVCMLGVGRLLRDGRPADIHQQTRLFQTMTPAEVWINPTGDYALNRPWPAEPVRVFKGLVAATGPKKIQGRTSFAVHLTHWTAALGFSSALTPLGHVANPTQLNASAILPSARSGAGSGLNISDMISHTVPPSLFASDTWAGVKTLFCDLAHRNTRSFVKPGECRGRVGDPGPNTDAIAALKLFEGPGGECSLGRQWSVPLAVVSEGHDQVPRAIRSAIGGELAAAYANTSFWDKLVAQICPAFGMAVVPRVETAIVIADLPVFNGAPWRTIKIAEYDGGQVANQLDRPLKGVGVAPAFASQTLPRGSTRNGIGPYGGCYVGGPQARGTFLVVGPPRWLSRLMTPAGDPKQQLLLDSRSGSVANGAQAQPPGRVEPPDRAPQLRKLASRYAEAVYHTHALRGRNGTLSGPLRFDIAPGSVVHVRGKPERFIAPDELAGDVAAYVARVTTAIDGQGGVAGTNFQLSHVRALGDEQAGGTSEHPLFGGSLHGGGRHGCPLIDELEDFGD